MKKQTPRKKKNNNLKPTVNKLHTELDELQQRFNSDDDRFLDVVIKDQLQTIDFSGRWSVVERLLKSAGIKDEQTILKYKERNEQFVAIYLNIERLKVTIAKEADSVIYRRQPVLKNKAHWILQQSGEFRNIKSIHNELVNKMGQTISIASLRSFITENKAVIDKLREDFKTELLTSSISVDSGRLKFWEEAYEYYYNRWRLDGKMSDFNACARILNEVRVEVKGDLIVKIDGKIDISHSIEANKSLNQKLGELNVILLNVAHAAQKAGINPLPLLTQLTNSYYSKWNGINNKPLTLAEKNELVPVSNFIKSYNWEEIKAKNQFTADMGTIEDAYVIDSEEEKEIIENKKQALKDLLKKKSS